MAVRWFICCPEIDAYYHIDKGWLVEIEKAQWFSELGKDYYMTHYKKLPESKRGTKWVTEKQICEVN